jgi:hypothetical protein
MKLRALYFGLLLFLAFGTRAAAQTTTYDTLTYNDIPIDSVFSVVPSDNLDSVMGLPDTLQAHMGGSDYVAVQFAYGNQVVTFDTGATMNVYWSRESSDSCAMDIQFQFYNFSGTPVLGPTVHIVESGPEFVENMTTIHVPDSGYVGYNALVISVGSNPNAGQHGADSCFLDAIVLVQHGSVTESVGQSASSRQPILLNYPNPFYHSMGTHVRVNTPVAGVGVISVTDALGQEVIRLPLGELNPGNQDVSLTLTRAGVFFVRLFVDGTPVGQPLEISGE